MATIRSQWCSNQRDLITEIACYLGLGGHGVVRINICLFVSLLNHFR
jgi:hypothetical protein